jgi:hypothetical protein
MNRQIHVRKLMAVIGDEHGRAQDHIRTDPNQILCRNHAAATDSTSIFQQDRRRVIRTWLWNVQPSIPSDVNGIANADSIGNGSSNID